MYVVTLYLYYVFHFSVLFLWKIYCNLQESVALCRKFSKINFHLFSCISQRIPAYNNILLNSCTLQRIPAGYNGFHAANNGFPAVNKIPAYNNGFPAVYNNLLLVTDFSKISSCTEQKFLHITTDFLQFTTIYKNFHHKVCILQHIPANYNGFFPAKEIGPAADNVCPAKYNIFFCQL